MKKAFQIFRRDIKRLFHNRAALLIVVEEVGHNPDHSYYDYV